MAKLLPTLTIVTTALVALAGCATTTSGQPVAVNRAEAVAPSRSTIEPPSVDPPTRERDRPRDNLPKKVGEMAALCADDPCTVTALEFTVDRIQVDPTCTEPYAPPPDNGHYIALSMTITTTEAFTEDMSYVVDFSPFSFEVIGPDGVTEVGDPGYGVYGCLAGSDFVPLDGLAAESRYVGVVVLDTRYTAGRIVLRMPGDPAGWEWTF